MIQSKGWDWKEASKDNWIKPSIESYFFLERWKEQGRESILDLGCGLGRHSILFAKGGFKVTAVDISKDAISYLRTWEKKEHVNIASRAIDMKNLPFSNSAFDALFSYNVIYHCDTDGFNQIMSEIKRVLKPGGEIFLNLLSKENDSFSKMGYPVVDSNTIIRTEDGPEKNVPHFYIDFNDIQNLMEDFTFISIRHIDDLLKTPKGFVHNYRYFVHASLNKEEEKLTYDIIGKTVKGIIDRPMGSQHPKDKELVYSINYGYVDDVIAPDGDNQDVYIMGVDHPISQFEGKVIAVYHRFNDNEDKWIVSIDNKDYTDKEIMDSINFVEQFFDGVLVRK